MKTLIITFAAGFLLGNITALIMQQNKKHKQHKKEIEQYKKTYQEAEAYADEEKRELYTEDDTNLINRANKLFNNKL